MAFKLSLSQNQTAKATARDARNRCGLVLLQELGLRILSSVQRKQLWLTLRVVGLGEKQGGSVVVPTPHGHRGFQGGCRALQGWQSTTGALGSGQMTG